MEGFNHHNIKSFHPELKTFTPQMDGFTHKMESFHQKMETFHPKMEAYGGKMDTFNSPQIESFVPHMESYNPIMPSNFNPSSSAVDTSKEIYPNHFINEPTTSNNDKLKKYRWTNDCLNFMLDSIIKNRESDQPKDLYKAKLWKDVTKEMNDVGYAVKIRNCTRKFRNLKVCNT